MRLARSLALSVTLAGCGLLAACGRNEPAQPALPRAESPSNSTKRAEIPKPTDAQMKQVQRAWDAAGKLVTQARALRTQGEEIERTQSRDAANDTLAQARKLYREAIESTEEWIEPELGPFSQETIDKYLGAFLSERHAWITESAKMGKLHD